MMLPKLPGNKTAVFTKRIVEYHETFAPLAPSKKVKNQSIKDKKDPPTENFNQALRIGLALGISRPLRVFFRLEIYLLWLLVELVLTLFA